MKTLIFALVFLTASSALAGDGKWKNRLMVWSLDLPPSNSVSQMQSDCKDLETALTAKLAKVAEAIRTTPDTVSLYTDLYLYDPSNTGIDASYVCSLTLKSNAINIGFRLLKFSVEKGKDYLAKCKTDSDNIASIPNILLVQTDSSWDLIGGKKCQAYGVEIGQL